MSVSKARTSDAASARLAASITSYALDIPVQEIIEERRGSARAAFARQVAMYLCHIAFEFSLARVANAFGRDRSTVAHACHSIEDRRDEARFDQWIAELEETLRETPAPGCSTDIVAAAS